MHANRQKAIKEATNAKNYGLILGSLGRQGSPNILQAVEDKLKALNKNYITILLSEIFPDKLKLIPDVDA